MHTKQSFTRSWQWRYGFLALLLPLFAWSLWLLPGGLKAHLPAPFTGIIISLMLIFNHVAFMCVPSGRIAAGLRVFAVIWLAFGCAYVFTRGFSGFF